MFSAGSITVCCGLSSSGAHGQENYEKQVKVGGTCLCCLFSSSRWATPPGNTLLVLPFGGNNLFRLSLLWSGLGWLFFCWAPSWWAGVPGMVAPKASLGPVYELQVEEEFTMTMRLVGYICVKKYSFFSYFCKISSIVCFECFTLLFRGCGFLCAPMMSQCWAQVLTIKLEPSVRSGTEGGEEGEASLPKIWLKIKLLDFDWHFSSSCLSLFTFPPDLETRTGPVACSSRWTRKFGGGFTSLLGSGWGTSGGLISQHCRFVAFPTELLSEETPIDVCYWFFVWRENWRERYIYASVCVYIYIFIHQIDWTNSSFWVTAAFWSRWKSCHGWDDVYWAFLRFPGLRKKWGMDDLDLGEQQQQKSPNKKNLDHISNLPSPPISKCAF